MSSIFLAPHNDDEALFGAFTIMREKPIVFVLTDSHIQPNRGEVGCDAETRWAESKAAMEILGAIVVRVGVKDYELQPGNLAAFFKGTYGGGIDKVYAPAMQSGNPHHDMVSLAAKEIWGDKVVFYSTYAAGEFFTKGDIEIKPTDEEITKKIQALACYKSQLALPSTRPHFEAVKGQSEWFVIEK